MKLAQSLRRHALQAIGLAFGQTAVGMIRIQIGPESFAGQGCRALQAELQTGQQLVAQTLEGVLREAGAGDHLGEQGQRRVELVGGGEGAQAGQGHVPMGAIGKLRTETFEAGGDGAGVLIAGAFVEHGIGHGRQPRQAAVATGARGEQQLYVEHGQLFGLHEVHPGALLGSPVLQIEVAPRRWLVEVDLLQ